MRPTALDLLTKHHCKNCNTVQMHFSKLATNATSLQYYVEWKSRLDLSWRGILTPPSPPAYAPAPGNSSIEGPLWNILVGSWSKFDIFASSTLIFDLLRSTVEDCGLRSFDSMQQHLYRPNGFPFLHRKGIARNTIKYMLVEECTKGCFKKSSPPPSKTFGKFSLRLRLFAWNFAHLLAVHIHITFYAPADCAQQSLVRAVVPPSRCLSRHKIG